MRMLSLLVASCMLSSSAFALSQRIDTAQGAYELSTVVDGLAHPWSLAFLPDGRKLVTERDGRLRYISKDNQLSPPIQGLPAIDVQGQGGLLDVLIDNQFQQNQRIFFSFSEKGPNGNSTALASATLKDQALVNVTTIFSQAPKMDSKFHFGGRIVQQANGDLFLTLGDRAFLRKEVQQLDNQIGKVVHIHPDGTAVNTSAQGDARIWSLGHRNIQGAALDAQGRLWTHEHGPQGGDEINLTEQGKNYGWPLITYGEEYGGGKIGETKAEGLEQPKHYWVPSIAPSGMAFYQGQQFPEWQGDLLVGSLKFGLLVRLDVDGDRIVSEQRIPIGKRVRWVGVGPDEAIYLLTDEDNGALLRLTKAN